MIIYLAEAFFPVPGKDPRLFRMSFPAPVDPETPEAPWHWDRVAHQAAHLSRAGFTHVLLPPALKTQSGDKPTGTGYGVFDHYDLGSKDQQGSVETRFGSRERLHRAIAVSHANGLRVLGNMVLHQMAGGRAGVYRYKGADDKKDVGRFPKDPGCFRGGVDSKEIPPFRPSDPVPAPWDDFPFGDEFVYRNSDPPGYTAEAVSAWADWFCRSTDIDGFRIDDTKGLNVDFLKDFLSKGEMADRWCFSEFFEGNPDTLEWYVRNQMDGQISTLDFTNHWRMKGVLDFGAPMYYWRPAGYATRDPFRSVEFVDTPDTDNSPGQQIINSKLLAYAYMLLALEGVPLVYHRDYATEAGCYGLQPYIDNMVWCHTHLIGGQTAVRHVDEDVIVLERLGHQVNKPGALTALSKDPWNYRTITCRTAFGAHAHLHDYTGHHNDIWTDAEGWATFTVPSNHFGRGNSYVCFSRVGVNDDPKREVRRTTQTFFGAADLDIPPAGNGNIRIGRIWCDEGTAVGGELRVTLPVGGKLMLVLSGDTHNILATYPVNSDGVSFPPVDGNNPHPIFSAPKGWLAFDLQGSGLPKDGVEYALTVVYSGAPGL